MGAGASVAMGSCRVPVEVPRVRDRKDSVAGEDLIRFRSPLAPPCLRKRMSVEDLPGSMRKPTLFSGNRKNRSTVSVN